MRDDDIAIESPAEMTEEQAKAAAQVHRMRAIADAELIAMTTAFEALYRLPEAAKRRAMRWLDEAIYRLPDHYDEEPPF